MTYTINYDHVTGPNSLPNLSFFELVNIVSDLENNPYVIESSIEIITIKP